MTATTDSYCVAGNPVAHSRSPWIHARFAELTGQPLSYERTWVPLDGFATFVQDFAAAGGKGCNVTVPFKLQAAELATSASERVRLAGAANTLVFSASGIHADNTDGLGIVADITRNAGIAIAGCDVLLLGAGGAAAGALGSLLEQKPRRIAVVNRTHARAEVLVAQHAADCTRYCLDQAHGHSPRFVGGHRARRVQALYVGSARRRPSARWIVTTAPGTAPASPAASA